MAPKKYPTSKQFSTELEKGLKGEIFFLLGEEEGEKDKIISRIQSLHFKEGDDRQQNTGRYYINDDRSSQEELISAADFAVSGSMFSERRLCVIRNFQNVKTNDTVKNIVGDTLKSLPDGTILIITSTENQPVSWLSSQFGDSIRFVQFWKNFDSDLINYVKKGLSAIKKDFDERVVPLIIELAGNDIRKIDELIDLIIVTSPDMPLSADLVRDLAGDIREISVFDFVNSLFMSERKSLLYLKRLIDEGTAELLILNMIIREADSIERYYTLLDSKLNHDEAIAKMGLAASKLRREKFVAIQRRTNRERLKKIFPLIARAEYSIKSSGSPYSIISSPVFTLASEMLMMK